MSFDSGSRCLYISIRKTSDINKPLFTINLTKEAYWDENKTMSISQYVNSDGCDVLYVKQANSYVDNGDKYNLLKAYIKKEEIWSEIKADKNLKLDE